MSFHLKFSKVSFPLYFLFCLMVCLFVFEFGLRFFVEPHSPEPLHRFRRDTSYFFDLNPQHPEITREGFRKVDLREEIEPNSQKIVFLGDSVTFGLFVSPTQAFPALFSKKIKDDRKNNIEVINAGINGYTLYNEVGFFRERIKALKPKAVILGFCLNDVVNPVIHWQEPDFLQSTPLAAYPRGKEEQEEATEWVRKKKSGLYQGLSNFAIFRFLDHALMLAQNQKAHRINFDGKKWPRHLADESRKTIEALADPQSLEWQWLEKNILTLKKEIESVDAQFVLLILPLAYQLNPDYPIRIDEVFEDFCEKNKIMCFNPLEYFSSEENKKEIFMGSHRHHLRDIWHFSVFGHQKMAEFLYVFLKQKTAGLEVLKS